MPISISLGLGLVLPVQIQLSKTNDCNISDEMNRDKFTRTAKLLLATRKAQ